MADKVKKFLSRLSRKEFELVEALLLDIRNGEIEHLDCKPLKGCKDRFRVRKGRLRVVFTRSKTGTITIRHISHRDDQTYRHMQ
jgi:mRNA-degrading endonuclease RelE of RelBE toxin-antitoxin system